MLNKLQLCKRLNWNYFCHILLWFWFESHPIQILFWQLQFLFFRLLQGNKLRIWHFSFRYLLEFEMSRQDGNEFREMSFGHLSVLTIVVWWFQSLFRPKLTLDWPIRAEHDLPILNWLLPLMTDHKQRHYIWLSVYLLSSDSVWPTQQK